MPLDLGNVTIHRIVEQELALMDGFAFFPTLTPGLLAENPWLQPRFFDAEAKIILCVQSYLIESAGRRILVDTCVGNDKPRHRAGWNVMKSARYENNLKALGLTPDDIDVVMCTHLHVDHVGWNTRLDNGRWVPTFPNARYLFSGTELDHWTARHAADPAALPHITDSVLPVVAAGQVDRIASDLQFDDNVTLFPTPGHTVDHFSVRVGRPGADAVITGDMVHSPLQIAYPEIGMFADFDSASAARSRQTLFSACCDTSTILCTAHFPSPSSVRIVSSRKGFVCEEVAAG